MPNQQNNQSNSKSLGLYGLGDYSAKQIKIFAKSFEMEDLSPKEFYDRRPDAAPSPMGHIRMMPPKTASQIVPDAFAGETGLNLLKNMTVEQLGEIGANGDPVLKLSIKNAFDRLSKTESTRNSSQIKNIREYLTYSPAWKF